MKPQHKYSGNRIGFHTWWVIGLVFVVLGILNILYVSWAAGLFYLLIALLYLPPSSGRIEKFTGLKLHYLLKIILALLILWGTLAVGDLFELLEQSFR